MFKEKVGCWKLSKYHMQEGGMQIIDTECKCKAWGGTSTWSSFVTWHCTCRDIIHVKWNRLEMFESNTQVFVTYVTSRRRKSEWHNFPTHLLGMVASSSDRIVNIANKLPHLLCMFFFARWSDILMYKQKQSLSLMYFTITLTHVFHIQLTYDNFSRTLVSSPSFSYEFTHLHFTLTNMQLHMHTYNCKLS